MITKEQFLKKVSSRSLAISVVGLGYVGLPLAVEFAKEGFKVIGIDIDKRKVDSVNASQEPHSRCANRRCRRLGARRQTFCHDRLRCVERGRCGEHLRANPLLANHATQICLTSSPLPMKWRNIVTQEC